MKNWTYAALGDSTGLGVGASDKQGYVRRVFARISDKIPGARLVNLCVSGSTSGDVLARQVDRATSAQPELVTLFIGGNDLWRGTDPSRFRSTIDAIAERLAKTRAAVLIGTLPNLAHAPAAAYAESLLGISRSAIERRVITYNEALVAAATRHAYETVDLFQVGLADRAHYFWGDGFHPSSEGYAFWTDLLWPSVERVITRRAA